jgi:hypothetical protein
MTASKYSGSRAGLTCGEGKSSRAAMQFVVAQMSSLEVLLTGRRYGGLDDSVIPHSEGTMGHDVTPTLPDCRVVLPTRAQLPQRAAP